MCDYVQPLSNTLIIEISSKLFETFVMQTNIQSRFNEQLPNLLKTDERPEIEQSLVNQVFNSLLTNPLLHVVRLHAIRLFLDKIAAVFDHKIHAYALLESYYNLPIKEQAQQLQFAMDVAQDLKSAQMLPVTLIQTYELIYGSEPELNLEQYSRMQEQYFPLNIMLIGTRNCTRLQVFNGAVLIAQYLREHETQEIIGQCLRLFDSDAEAMISALAPCGLYSSKMLTSVQGASPDPDDDASSSDGNPEMIEQKATAFEKAVNSQFDKILGTDYADAGSTPLISDKNFGGYSVLVVTDVCAWEKLLEIEATVTGKLITEKSFEQRVGAII